VTRTRRGLECSTRRTRTGRNRGGSRRVRADARPDSELPIADQPPTSCD
jgi:hypothetical protein